MTLPVQGIVFLGDAHTMSCCSRDHLRGCLGIIWDDLEELSEATVLCVTRCFPAIKRVTSTQLPIADETVPGMILADT